MFSVNKPRARAVLSVGLLAASLVGCSDEAPVAVAESGATEQICTATQAAPGAPKIYFAPFDSVEQQVLCVLDTAEEEVVVAHYNIRRDSYLDKLVELQQRGVRVRVAVDERGASRDYNLGDDFLEEHGIELTRTKPSGSRSLMHLKVAVVDGEIAMTGSFNWNGTAALANDENMIVLRDPALVDRYRGEVLEVLGDGPSDESGAVTENIALHFSPDEDLDTRIVERVDAATVSVDVAMYTFTMSSVADALLRAVGRGLAVRVVMEQKQSGGTSVDEQLEQAGATVVRGANRLGAYSAMHHKYAVIDGETVITGATNWTYNGTRNSDEDLLIIRSTDVAQRYSDNFADLLHIYAGIEATDIPPSAQPGVLLNTIHDATNWGDAIVVTGNHPALGNWDPYRGLPLETSPSMFPSWTARARIEPNTQIEYKFVQITADGQVIWEPGQNRVLAVSERSEVVSATFGDTNVSWTPRETP